MDKSIDVHRSHLLEHEKERLEILKQCGPKADPLKVDSNFDIICKSLTEFRTLGLDLKILFKFQEEVPAIYPWNAEYDSVRQNVNHRFNIFPLVIVRATRSSDIKKSLDFVKKYKLILSLRGAAHCFESFSLCNGLVLDQKRRNKVKVNTLKQTVTIHPGSLLGKVISKLGKYNLAVPTGTCPSNGSVGYSLGGGIGFLTKKFSVTSDNIVSVKILLADGNIVDANDSQYSDLFWALRGAGIGNYGIVLSLTLRVYPLRSVTIFRLTFDHLRLFDVLNYWVHWTDPNDVNLTSEFKCSNGRGAVYVEGVYLGSRDELETKLSGFKNFTKWELFEVPYAESARYFGEPGRWFPFFKTKNSFVTERLPPAAISIIQHYMSLGDGNSTFALDEMGGNCNKIKSDATAFVHRNTLYWMLINSRWSYQDQGPDNLIWINNFYRDLTPYLSRQVYQNAPDIDLDNPLERYYGSNFPRLREIKIKYDPQNIFSYQQSIIPN